MFSRQPYTSPLVPGPPPPPAAPDPFRFLTPRQRIRLTVAKYHYRAQSLGFTPDEARRLTFQVWRRQTGRLIP